jgi:hypothetical protein
MLMLHVDELLDIAGCLKLTLLTIANMLSIHTASEVYNLRSIGETDSCDVLVYCWNCVHLGCSDNKLGRVDFVIFYSQLPPQWRHAQFDSDDATYYL